ncbi:MAG: TerC/Alx family metal homeostasis membrane protein [Propionibacteriaceae bacterium]|jgi:tellurite resistance protein TerC|nr:TerC/Alx family metal homeostasis membrane protein [Propionibacteriaceae bacterium]
MHVTLEAWLITVGILVAVLAVDVFVIGRRPHVPGRREILGAIIGYCLLAVAFGIGIYFVYGEQGPRYSAEFFAGWITEYSLSADNLFIFIIIMANLRVPQKLQQFALMIGIILALVFRLAFILIGAAVIEQFAWVFYLFGAFLIYTAVKLFLEYRTHGGDDEKEGDNAFMRFVKAKLPVTDEFYGEKVMHHVDGKLVFTGMFLVIMALGSTDLLFALDSIPAIYGLTQEAYLVFAANVFALMGLRQLYFLIGGLMKRLVYLSVGLAVILGFIGVKLVLHAMAETGLADTLGIAHEYLEVPIWLSLTVIIGVLAVTAVASLLKSRGAQGSSGSASP